MPVHAACEAHGTDSTNAFPGFNGSLQRGATREGALLPTQSNGSLWYG
jgi:hypothetical protein